MSNETPPFDAAVQQNEQPDAPSVDAHPSGVTCRRCRVVNEMWQPKCHACGSFLPGNLVALVHGGRRLQQHGPTDGLQQARQDQVRDGLLADAGSELSTARGIVIDRLAEVTLLAESTWLDIKTKGWKTPGGRRRPVVDLYMSASAAAARLAQVLGLARAGRDVLDMSPSEWVLQQQEREQTAQAPSGDTNDGPVEPEGT